MVTMERFDHYHDWNGSHVPVAYAGALKIVWISMLLGNDSICFFLAHALRVIERDRAFEKVL
jgi:hypothetical protein